ncbi:ABC transporter substrate-binding protein, partial [Frankia sp. Mgl5]|nr:ABC transporter substrate-binding protein [Frankia sp. Mgl5]
MIRKTRLLVTAVACCVALLLAACGGGGDTSPSTGVSAKPVAGGEGRILTLSDPRTLDPAILGNA